MDEVEVFSVTKCDEGYNVVIPANTNGEEVMKSLAVLVHELGNRQRENDKNFSDLAILRGVEIWLRFIKDEQ